jgi:hypothetical protein
MNDIVKEILKKGDLQVGEKEREHDLTSLRKEIATMIAEKCVDPGTQRPYPVGIIEKAMTEVGYSVKQNKTAKSQVISLYSLTSLMCNDINPFHSSRYRNASNFYSPSRTSPSNVPVCASALSFLLKMRNIFVSGF